MPETVEQIVIHRAFRFKLYPTPEQAETLSQFVGATRFILHDSPQWRGDLRPYSGVHGIYCIAMGGRCYVGSAVNLSSRLSTHASHLRKNIHHCPPLQAAFNKYGADAFCIEILEIVEDKADLATREQHWMDALGAYVGNGGFNVLPTARTPFGHRKSAETRAKIAAAHKGRKHTEEHRRNNSLAQKGKRLPQESYDRGAAKRRGMQRSAEAIAKAAESNRGQKRTPEQRARMSAWQKGKPPSPKLAAALAKISEANRGRKHSEETKAKMAAARRAYWEKRRSTAGVEGLLKPAEARTANHALAA